MNRPFQINPNRKAQLLREAASRRLVASVTCKMSDGWATLKTRFLALEDDRHELIIEYPSSPGRVAPEIVGGQSIGVSFRRGHKKCVFNAMVLERCHYSFSKVKGVPALRLQWPEEMCELQRRLYYRAVIPEGTTIPVDLWRGDAKGVRPPESEILRGIMLDLSAGGISIALPFGAFPRLEEDKVATCSFPVDKGEPPATIVGRVRYWDETDAHHLRVGLHFVNLDSSPNQRETLERVVRLAIRFQRAHAGRRGKSKNKHL